MAAYILKDKLRERALTLLFLVCCMLTACQKEDDSASRQPQDKAPLIAEEQVVPIPPIELLAGNCDIASHVALVDACDIEIAEEIHADDGTLGYVIEKVSANLLRSFKGDFGESRRIVYYSFLEYPTAPESTRLDSLLVFLKQDPDKGRFSVIEVGQFRYSDSLGRIIESLCRGK